MGEETPGAVKLVIVGSGPAGLAAAVRAAELGVPHLLLERQPHLSDTIYRYQRGKHVMATPHDLPLRGLVPFEEGTREALLDSWAAVAADVGVQVWHGAEVVGIDGEAGAFHVRLADGRAVRAEAVVLAIGMQGNVRKLGVPGSDDPRVQYQLDDPLAYADERVAVVGAGDSAIENALGLAVQNEVFLLNRRDEFARAKPANVSALNALAERGGVEIVYGAKPVALTEEGLTVRTPTGEETLPVDRVVARIGAIPPRRFLESLGIAFPSADPRAIPEVSARWESNRPGVFLVGALAGYPLIKQALNQGWEVVGHFLGDVVVPADQPLLARVFAPVKREVEEALDLVQANVPLVADLTRVQLREALLAATAHAPARGETIFERNDYSNSVWVIVEGSVQVLIDPGDRSKRVMLRRVQFFGEMGLISGRRRTATVVAWEGCFLVEIPRRAMIKLQNSFDGVREQLGHAAVVRKLHLLLGELDAVDEELLHRVARASSVESLAKGELLFREGESASAMYLVNRGSMAVVNEIGGREVVLAYLPAGSYVGATSLLFDQPRSATVRASIDAELIRIGAEHLLELVAAFPQLRTRMEGYAQAWAVKAGQRERDSGQGPSSNVIQFLIRQGLGEATDVLLIDESLCVRCDNCETACAATHLGVSRLDREAGPTYASLHVPTSCRHCEDPKCMTDCPPDAIHRAADGEVFIDDSCIGCGACATNCPYDVIQMAVPKEREDGLLQRMFGRWFSWGWRAPVAEARKVAVKCDMCRDLSGGPACVRSCPTGAAIRVGPETFFDVTGDR